MRNQLIEKDKFMKLAIAKGSVEVGAIPVYNGVYYYDDMIKVHFDKYNSIKKYEGKLYIDYIPVDIDKGSNSDSYTLTKLRRMLDRLNCIGLSRSSFQVYFSGSGYHIMISNKEFGFQPSNELAIQVEGTMKSLGLLEDPSVLRKTALIRSPHTINAKPGVNLFKVPLTMDEAYDLSVEEIKEIA